MCEDHGTIWLSCVPWFSFNAVTPTFNREISIPQFIWDKFSFEGDKVYTNLMILAHHGFVDGLQIAKFLDTLNDIIENIEDYTKN